MTFWKLYDSMKYQNLNQILPVGGALELISDLIPKKSEKKNLKVPIPKLELYSEFNEKKLFENFHF